MALMKCPRCGKVFDKVRSPVCVRCRDEEERDYDKIRESLERHPNMNADETVKDAQVDLAVITRMVKEGFMVDTAQLAGSTKCGMCSAPAISLSKKLCQACLEKLKTRVTKMQRAVNLDDAKQDGAAGSRGTSVLSTVASRRRRRG